MEWKIGEIRQIDGEWYQCIESHFSCEGCDFKNTSRCNHEGSECSYPIRQDHTSVIFKELEKIGEPYDDCGTILQRFKIYTNVTNADTKGLELHIYSNNTIGIEIKENKEDMKEGKIQHYDCFFDKEQSKPNLKPFSLELAKQGKPVCTKNGKKARIICFDARFPKTGNIVTLVEKENGEEVTLYHYDDGHCSIGRGYDLMMSTEKKEGWINIYKGGLLDTKSYSSKEEAVSKASQADYIDTIKIEWEE